MAAMQEHGLTDSKVLFPRCSRAYSIGLWDGSMSNRSSAHMSAPDTRICCGRTPTMWPRRFHARPGLQNCLRARCILNCSGVTLWRTERSILYVHVVAKYTYYWNGCGNCRDVFLRERKLLKRTEPIKRSRTRVLKCAGYYGVWKRINMSNALIGSEEHAGQRKRQDRSCLN